MVDGKSNVLIVDDDPTILESIKLSLDQLGLQTRTASGTTRGLSLAREVHPDLVLCDIVMPERDGYGFLASLRADADLAHIPVVLMTGVAAMQDRMRAVDAGADDLLTKPFDEAELVSRVKALLRLKAREDQIRESNAKLRERMYFISTLFMVGNQLGDSMESADVFRVIREMLETIVGAEAYTIYVRQGDSSRFTLVVQRGLTSPPTVLDVARMSKPMASAIKAKQPSFHPEDREPAPKLGDSIPIRTLVPLVAGQKTIGLVYVHAFAAERGDSLDFELMRLLSSQVAGVLHQMRLHRELQEYSKRFEEASEKLVRKNRELEQQMFQLHTLMLFSTQLHSTVDLAGVHATIRDLLINVIGVAQYRLVFIDRVEQHVTTGRADGVDPLPDREGWTQIVDQIMALGQPILTPGPGFVVAVPLLVSGEPQGALLVRALLPQKAALTGEDVEMLSLLAHEAATALFTAHLYEQRAARRRDFYAMLAHDFRGPLQAQSLALEMLGSSGSLTETQRECLAQAVIANTRLVHLVDDFLTYSQIEAGAINLNLAPTDLVDLVEETVSEVRRQIEDREHTLTTALPDRRVVLRADAHHLKRALANLLLNAAKYTEKGGQILIGLEPSAGEVLIQVQDNGSGISAEELSLLFTRYHRGDAAGKATQGTGLGLVIVKEVVEAHGGHVWVESEGVAGKGSTFSLVLPANTQPLGDLQTREGEDAS